MPCMLNKLGIGLWWQPAALWCTRGLRRCLEIYLHISLACCSKTCDEVCFALAENHPLTSAMRGPALPAAFSACICCIAWCLQSCEYESDGGGGAACLKRALVAAIPLNFSPSSSSSTALPACQGERVVCSRQGNWFDSLHGRGENTLERIRVNSPDIEHFIVE